MIKKVLFFIYFTSVLLNKISAQVYIDPIFLANKAVADTSENKEDIIASVKTFKRLLIGNNNDSLVHFYYALSELKLAYILLNEDSLQCVKLLNSSYLKFKQLDTGYKFGPELQIVNFFNKIVTAKLNKATLPQQQTLEKELNQFYILNKKMERANLMLAYYNYLFFNKNKIKLQQSKNYANLSLKLFKQNNNGNGINWGKGLAKDLISKIKKLGI